MLSNKPIIDFETERLHIRNVSECDKDEYMSLRVNNSPTSKAYSVIPGFRDFEWDGELHCDHDIYLSVFLRPDEIFVASASIQHYRNETVELGYDVVEEYRNRGFATEIVKGLVMTVHDLDLRKRIIIRTDIENEASKKVAEKCGAKIIEYEDPFVSRMLSKTLDSYKDSKKYNDVKQYVEKNKSSVCVYEFT